MKESIFISIVVPTYNRIDELKRCINSVLNQTFNYWELIVVDDISTDDSFNIISNWILEDKRVTIIKRPKNFPKGANTCRNIGIQKAKGSYIAFLDSDDYWKRERLSNLKKFLNKSNAKAIYSGAKIVSTNGSIYRKSRQLYKNESPFDFLISSDTFSPTPSMVVSKKVLEKVCFDESLHRHQDFDFFIRVSEITGWFYFESQDITVFNEQRVPKKIDFKSCVAFYQKHKEKSLIKEKRVKYLNYISESCAKINPNRKVLSYYKSQLIYEGVELTLRQKLIFQFPYIFHFLFKVKGSIK